MDTRSVGKSTVAAVCLALLVTACTKPPQPPAEPVSNEPGPPPATPVVPVQSQPLDSPAN